MRRSLAIAAGLLILAISAPKAWALFTVHHRPHEPTPCTGDCVPRAELVASERRSQRRLAGWNRSNREIMRLRVRVWRPTFEYAIALASAVYGVPPWQMRNVAECESTLNPFAKNGIHRGYWQLGWLPFGFSPYDPVASALSTAQTVRHDGGWRQWVCKP